MKSMMAVLVMVGGIAALIGGTEALAAPTHRHGHNAARTVDGDAHLRHMQRLQRKHDLRRIYHDRRPRRPMRSL